MSRADLILAAAVETIAEGHVLHVRAERAPASRKLRTPALPARLPAVSLGYGLGIDPGLLGCSNRSLELPIHDAILKTEV